MRKQAEVDAGLGGWDGWHSGSAEGCPAPMLDDYAAAATEMCGDSGVAHCSSAGGCAGKRRGVRAEGGGSHPCVVPAAAPAREGLAGDGSRDELHGAGGADCTHAAGGDVVGATAQRSTARHGTAHKLVIQGVVTRPAYRAQRGGRRLCSINTQQEKCYSVVRHAGRSECIPQERNRGQALGLYALTRPQKGGSRQAKERVVVSLHGCLSWVDVEVEW